MRILPQSTKSSITRRSKIFIFPFHFSFMSSSGKDVSGQRKPQDVVLCCLKQQDWKLISLRLFQYSKNSCHLFAIKCAVLIPDTGCPSTVNTNSVICGQSSSIFHYSFPDWRVPLLLCALDTLATSPKVTFWDGHCWFEVCSVVSGRVVCTSLSSEVVPTFVFLFLSFFFLFFGVQFFLTSSCLDTSISTAWLRSNWITFWRKLCLEKPGRNSSSHKSWDHKKYWHFGSAKET